MENKIRISVIMLVDAIPGETADTTIQFYSKYLNEVKELVMQSKDCVVTFQEVER